MKKDRIRTYDYILKRISSIEPELERQRMYLNIARGKKYRKEAKKIRSELLAEYKAYNYWNRIKKAYIDTKAVYKEILENEYNFKRGKISNIKYQANKKYLENKLRRVSKCLSYEYIEEIKEDTLKSYSDRIKYEEANNIIDTDVKKKYMTPFIIGIVIVACISVGLVKYSIDKHPDNIYKDILSKRDEFSILMDEVKEKAKESSSPSPEGSIKPSDEVTEEPKEEYDNMQEDIIEPEEKEEIKVNYIR